MDRCRGTDKLISSNPAALGTTGRMLTSGWELECYCPICGGKVSLRRVFRSFYRVNVHGKV